MPWLFACVWLNCKKWKTAQMVKHWQPMPKVLGTSDR